MGTTDAPIEQWAKTGSKIQNRRRCPLEGQDGYPVAAAVGNRAASMFTVSYVWYPCKARNPFYGMSIDIKGHNKRF